MAKLTVTELKTLANEAAIRVEKQLEEANNKILNSKEYKEFSNHFNETPLGKAMQEASASCAKVATLLHKEFDEIDPYSRSHVSDKYTGMDVHAKTIMGKLRTKMFPLYEIGSLRIKSCSYNFKSYNNYGTVDLFEYFLHKLTLHQLTTSSDLSNALDSMVKDVVTTLLNEK